MLSQQRRIASHMTRLGPFLAGALLMLAFSVACSPDPTSPAAAVSPVADATSPSAPSVSATMSQCTADPQAHVYNPDRLRLLAACVTLTGTIELERAEADGDYHVRLRLDSGQTCDGNHCLDPTNFSQQGGDLVLEPVCENPITQADAVAACAGYRNPLVLPPPGSHVAATGPLVLDALHGWNEIHPLESISVMAEPGPSQSPSPMPSAAAGPMVLTVSITASTYGNVAAVTAAGASCTARARLPSGRYSTAAGLQVTVVAGADGAVSWSYRTVSTTTKGTGAHTVTCTLSGNTVSASAPFTVS